MIIPLKFGKKMFTKWSIFLKSMYVFHFIYTNKFMFVMSIKTDRLSDLPQHKRLQLFHMSSPFAAVVSYFNLKTQHCHSYEAQCCTPNRKQILTKKLSQIGFCLDLSLLQYEVTKIKTNFRKPKISKNDYQKKF